MSSFTVSYRNYFSNKWRRALIRWLELPSNRRQHSLFISHNDAIGSQIQAAGAYEPEVLKAIGIIARDNELADGVAIDIGANIGNHSLALARVFRRVLAFEPSPWLSLILRANALRNRVDNVEVFDCALGAHEAQLQLVELSREHTGMMQLSTVDCVAGSNQWNGHIVPVRVGDLVLQAAGYGEQHVAFIKIDVEGMEVSALRGLGSTLERCKPIIAFESRNRSEGMAVVSYLRDLGYSHFHALSASRIKNGAYPRLSDLLRATKRYSIVRLDDVHDRHYSAIFAWTRAL